MIESISGRIAKPATSIDRVQIDNGTNVLVPLPFKMPLSIEMYQALLRRLAKNHLVTYDVENDYNHRMTGLLYVESIFIILSLLWGGFFICFYI